jgi:hypothetical protein
VVAAVVLENKPRLGVVEVGSTQEPSCGVSQIACTTGRGRPA